MTKKEKARLGDDRLMTSNETCKYLQIERVSLYNLRDFENMPHYRIGRLYRFRKSEIDAWLKRRK